MASKTVDQEDIEDLSVGAAILGTGGGGDPHVGKLMAQQAIEEYGPVEMVNPDEVPTDSLVIPTAMMGAPTVVLEKLPAGSEPVTSLHRLAAEFDQELYATMPIECGGLNSTIPFTVAAKEGIPLIDGDGMGRAFPELHHETFNIYGVSGTPAVVSDEKQNTSLFETKDNRTLESFARAVTIEMGGSAFVCDYPMTGEEVAQTTIPNTISLGMRMGSAIRNPPSGTTPINALKEVTEDSNYGRAIELFEGKITDVERRTRGGFAVGEVQIEGLNEYDGSTLSVEFQNENLIARIDNDIVASVPDLITILERETGEPVTTEGLRYGYRVTVLGIPAPRIMRTDAALSVWGPSEFGYDIDFTPIEERYPGYYRECQIPDGKEGLLNL